MFIKKYKVVTKDGKNAPQLFDSIKDALKTVGASKIKKLEEVNYEEEISDTSIDKRNFVLISRKTNEEVIRLDML
jgi:hypothetical protein